MQRADLREKQKVLSPSSLISLWQPYFSCNGHISCPVSSAPKFGTLSPCWSHFTGALYSFTFTLHIGWVNPFHQDLLFMITLSKREKIENYFNDCRELSFLGALSLETWWRLHWWMLFSPGLSPGVTCCSCGFGERKHHFTLLAPKLGGLETSLELIGRIVSFMHPMSQQRH